MTKEEILKMEAGEELDRLVAEVMGEPMPEFTPENALELQLAGSPVKSPKGNWLCLCRYDEGDIPTWRPLPYSTDISAAWSVVEKMRELDYSFSLTNYDNYKLVYQVKFYNYLNPALSYCGVGTAPEAICKAALLTKLDEIKELEEKR